MDLYNDTYDRVCKLSKEDARILEIASGPGNVSQYLLEHCPDFNITGIDIAPNMVQIAKKNNPAAVYLELDCKDILSLDKTFDTIIAAFVTPYLNTSEVEKLIKDSSKLLSENGVFYLSTMVDDYTKSGFEKTSFAADDSLYVYYHEEVFLNNQLASNGFKIISTFQKQYPEKDGSFTNDMIFICRKTS
jgi:cyclopropane fatty-acyl-phospholipid synthase-like methyltransferase